MRKLLMLLILTCMCCFNALAMEMTTWETIKNFKHSIDFAEVRKSSEIDSNLYSFANHEHLFKAIENKNSIFHVMEENKNLSQVNSDSTSYEELSSIAFHTTNSTYKLHAADVKNYINYNSDKFSTSLKSMSSHHVEHLGHDLSIKSGDFIIGLKNTIALKSDEFNNWLKENSYDFFARRVINVNHNFLTNSTLIKTETIFPIELFTDISITSVGDSPFQNTYYTQVANNDTSNRKLNQFLSPDSNMIACSSPMYSVGSAIDVYSPFDDSLDVQIKDTGLACAEYMYTLPGSFNMNYNFNTGKAINPSLDIVTGIRCRDCYAFFGKYSINNLNKQLIVTISELI